jgi:hypothetical protein
LLILLDADVLLIDRRYPQDPKYSRNREALYRLGREGHELGMTTQAWLEVVGILSFTTSISDIAGLPEMIALNHRLTIIPDISTSPNYEGVSLVDVINQMARQMSLGDAVQAVQIELFAPQAHALLTWNAKHFRNKLTIPVLTPEEWLHQQPPPTAPTP